MKGNTVRKIASQLVCFSMVSSALGQVAGSLIGLQSVDETLFSSHPFFAVESTFFDFKARTLDFKPATMDLKPGLLQRVFQASSVTPVSVSPERTNLLPASSLRTVAAPVAAVKYNITGTRTEKVEEKSTGSRIRTLIIGVAVMAAIGYGWYHLDRWVSSRADDSKGSYSSYGGGGCIRYFSPSSPIIAQNMPGACPP